MTRAILTDIEGTTSSISFVKDVLFPYARDHVGAFVAANAENAEVRRWLAATAQEAGIAEDDRDAIVAVLRRWIAEDRKATPLKALQGMLWEAGYRDGVYRAHVYPEVAARLRAWKAQGLPLYVYSSGSVAAQKLFFRYSEAGDLLPLFDGHFDTEIGGKRESASYARIAESIGLPPGEILFLSDIVEELDAARAAGLQTTWLCRPPLQCPADSAHRCVGDFDAIAV
ncbi:MAG TPA: acireductone synthase [Tahibacter sp.]|uniref:acireductone synthase n=1 Tax=Tahibacter sp. TaxID=2056211 RepID=UPI002BD23527|nr:acireductone synthase [Tahibacter sp.]HSX59116.1 acireductone synthase [Tahibacter sp.]